MGGKMGRSAALRAVDPLDHAGFMAAVGELVEFLLGECGSDVLGDVQAVDQVEFAGRRSGAGAGDALVDDPQQVAAFGLCDVEPEFFLQLAGEGAFEVFAVFDVAAGRGVVGGVVSVTADEGDLVAAEDDGPGTDLDPGERGSCRLLGSTRHGGQYHGRVRGRAGSAGLYGGQAGQVVRCLATHHGGVGEARLSQARSLREPRRIQAGGGSSPKRAADEAQSRGDRPGGLAAALQLEAELVKSCVRQLVTLSQNPGG